MQLSLQVACDAADELPAHVQFEAWAAAAVDAAVKYDGRRAGGEVTVRVVDGDEMTELNRRYRGHNSVTDVLAFGFDGDGELPVAILGDVVICAPVMFAEAARRGILPVNHFAHLTVHGVLHLCGFDHDTESAAREMQALEREALAEFGIALESDAESVPVESSTTDSPVTVKSSTAPSPSHR